MTARTEYSGYRVHVGWTVNGSNRWRRFRTMEAAVKYVNAVFLSTGHVLTIEGDTTHA